MILYLQYLESFKLKVSLVEERNYGKNNGNGLWEKDRLLE